MKKVLSLVLALVLVLGAAMPTAFAFEDKGSAGENLKYYQFITGGVGGDLMENQEFTREQLAKVLAELNGKAEEAAKFEGALKFTDASKVGAWAVPYVAFAVEQGWLKGTDKNEYNPKGIVTGQELLSATLNVLGYTVEWAKVVEEAKTIGFVAAEGSLNRGQAFETLWKVVSEIPKKGSSRPLGVELGKIKSDALTLEVKATKANELTVTFNQAVDTAKTTFKVTRGTAAVTGKAVWSADATVATFTTDANMINGTYVVEATVKAEGENDVVVKAQTDVVARFVSEIKILNEVALTGSKGTPAVDAMQAFVYYDVVDQYGESVRNMTNINWSTSAKIVKTDRATGKLTIERTDDKAFTFGEQLFVSGVDTKTGKSVQATLKIGQQQALNSVKSPGYVKKGTSEIVKQLPAGFKASTYEMVFTLLDQNGNEYVPADASKLKEQITFVSDNILVIKDLNVFGPIRNIGGVDYATVEVTPGINVDRGGEVNVMAIANRTGNKSVINTVVGEFQILTAFDIVGPVGMIADGESVEISFTALDQKGEKITNFRTIARNESFNALNLTVSEGTLTLSEQADGTAKLMFKDKTMAWTETSTTDGQDRLVSMTSIVVGGNTSNVMVSIQDKARPSAVKAVSMDKVLVHGGSTTLELTGDDSTFTFFDQYGREMEIAAADAFFGATFVGHNNDFNGYKFAVRAEYKGDDTTYRVSGTAIDGDTTAAIVGTKALASNNQFYLAAGNTLTISADGAGAVPTTVRSGMTARFDIVKFEAAAPTLAKPAKSESPIKSEALSVVNISQVRSITINELPKIYIHTTQSAQVTGESLGATNANSPIWTTPVTANANPAAVGYVAAHTKKVTISGMYGAEKVTIPSAYAAPSSTKLAITNVTGAAFTITGPNTGLVWGNLYDTASTRFVRKDASVPVEVIIYKDMVSKAAINKLTTASRTLTVSDASPVLTKITGADTWTVAPDNTEILAATINGRFTDATKYKYLDQYDVAKAATLRYRISETVENKDGYANNNLNFSGNDTNALSLVGVERGDTFKVTIVATDGIATITKEVAMTSGADKKAYISNADGNMYLKGLINLPTGKLEQQRLDSMK